MPRKDELCKLLCSYSNLELAYKKARKHKTQKPDVIAFEQNLQYNLETLRNELLLHAYNPKPLTIFIIRDPKTRTIHRSDFRDRVIHHALCNVIEPLFEKSFIYDSYANRKSKGTLKAINCFQEFSRKVSKNNKTTAFVFKADIKMYFENVNHDILLSLIEKKISDKKVLWLIKRILSNYQNEKESIGMPLGNLTSQFFANIYLHELDHYVKQTIHAKYYIRYVDDFVILHPSRHILQEYKRKIDSFLEQKLALTLHPDKSKILSLDRGIGFLGMRVFPHHRLLKKKNLRTFQNKWAMLTRAYHEEKITYDSIYDFLEGWCAYAKHANTCNFRKKILSQFEEKFSHEISAKEIHCS